MSRRDSSSSTSSSGSAFFIFKGIAWEICRTIERNLKCKRQTVSQFQKNYAGLQSRLTACILNKHNKIKKERERKERREREKKGKREEKKGRERKEGGERGKKGEREERKGRERKEREGALMLREGRGWCKRSQGVTGDRSRRERENTTNRAKVGACSHNLRMFAGLLVQPCAL